MFENFRFKLVLLAVFVPLVFLVHFLAGLVMTPDWAQSLIPTQFIIAGGLAFLIVEFGLPRMLGRPRGSYGRSMKIIMAIAGAGALALSIFVGVNIHREDHAPRNLGSPPTTRQS